MDFCFVGRLYFYPSNSFIIICLFGFVCFFNQVSGVEPFHYSLIPKGWHFRERIASNSQLYWFSIGKATFKRNDNRLSSSNDCRFSTNVSLLGRTVPRIWQRKYSANLSWTCNLAPRMPRVIRIDFSRGYFSSSQYLLFSLDWPLIYGIHFDGTTFNW